MRALFSRPKLISDAPVGRQTLKTKREIGCIDRGRRNDSGKMEEYKQMQCDTRHLLNTWGMLSDRHQESIECSALEHCVELKVLKLHW